MFRDRLKQLRKQKGITQEELARVIGVERSAVGQYEGKRGVIPSDPVKIKIAEYFGVSIDYLLGKTDFANELQNEKAPDDGGQRMDRIREQIVMALGQVDDHEAAMVYGYIQALKESRKGPESPNP